MLGLGNAGMMAQMRSAELRDGQVAEIEGVRAIDGILKLVVRRFNVKPYREPDGATVIPKEHIFVDRFWFEKAKSSFMKAYGLTEEEYEHWLMELYHNA